MSIASNPQLAREVATLGERIRASSLDPAVDYAIPPELVDHLSAATLLDADLRAELLRQVGRIVGPDRLTELFAQFIGLANSVVANNREMVELFLITDAQVHPHTAEKINLPTIRGALEGVRIATGVDSAPLCHGCAFRLGTPANQSPCTTLDADSCADPGEPTFYCHAHVDEAGNPDRACAGFAQQRSQRKRDELPDPRVAEDV